MKVNLFLSTHVGKDGKCRVLMILRHSYSQRSISLPVAVEPKYWSKDAQRVKKMENYRDVNRKLDNWIDIANSVLLDLMERDGSIDVEINEAVETVRFALISGKKEKVAKKKKTFSDVFEQFIRFKKGKTYDNYRNTHKKLIKFLGESKYKSLRFEEMDRCFLMEFENFMSQTCKQNTIAIHLRNIRAVFNFAIDEEITKFYPFRKMKIRFVETPKRSLSVEELRQLFYFPVNNSQRKYLELFMLQFMFCGINFADLVQLKKVVRNRIEFNRSKTMQLISLYVQPEAKILLERNHGRKYLVWVLDHYSNHEDCRKKMNKSLQTIGEEHRLGKGGRIFRQPIFPDVTSYWARHTWATIAASIDVPIEVISASLGHELGSRTTRIYIRYDKRKIDNANRAVLDWVLYGRINGQECVAFGSPKFYGLPQSEIDRLHLPT